MAKKKPPLLLAEDEAHHRIVVGDIVDIPAKVLAILPGKDGKTDRASTQIRVLIQTEVGKNTELVLDPGIVFFVMEGD